MNWTGVATGAGLAVKVIVVAAGYLVGNRLLEGLLAPVLAAPLTSAPCWRMSLAMPGITM